MEKIFAPKLFTLLKTGIGREQLIKDGMAGIVVGVVALPLSIAFAVASGVSPDKGLVTAIVAGFIISFLGGSRVQIGGPTGAFIVIIYGILAEYGFNGLMISTLMAGAMLVVFGLLRLGALLKYFPQPLITGFTAGIALVIFSTQIKDALGLEIDNLPSGFLPKWHVYLQNLNALNIYALGITFFTILITIYGSKILRGVPGSFLAIIAVTALVKVFQLPVNTIGTFFGEIPAKFHFQVPNMEWENLSQYLSPAITIALLGGIESLLSAVVADGMIGGRHRSNTELIAQGLANMAVPFFGGIPATGAIARTATNVKNGGRTPIAGMVHALTLLCIMLFVGKWARLIPMPCLAGILIVVAYNMSEWRSFKALLTTSFFEALVLLTTFFLTVLVDLTIAIQVGVVLSALLFMKRMADIGIKFPNVPDGDVIEDYSGLPKEISIFEISGPFFFASARQYAEIIKQAGEKSKILIIRMRHVPFMDSTGLQNFKHAVKWLKDEGILVILSGVNQNVIKDLKKSGIISLIGEEHIFNAFEKAVEHAGKNLKDKNPVSID